MDLNLWFTDTLQLLAGLVCLAATAAHAIDSDGAVRFEGLRRLAEGQPVQHKRGLLYLVKTHWPALLFFALGFWGYGLRAVGTFF